MAILFFDGFDRCTITKQLDRNYWSFQPLVPVDYEKYAFGGYRPGGTSSYQPASPIIVRSPGSDQQLDSLERQSESGQNITPASFEAQLGSPQIPFQTNK